MKKYLVKIWFIIASVILFGFVFGGLSLINKQRTSARNFEMQQKCAVEASKFFKQYAGEETALNGYSNHYNIKLNKCFILTNITFKVPGGSDYITGSSLKDVLENKDFGEYASQTQLGQGTCLIYEFGKENIQTQCKSKEEFDNLVEQYMKN